MNLPDKNPAQFPIHVLTTALQQVIQRVHAETQAPFPLIASALLGVMSLSCHDYYDVESKRNMRHPITLYQIILAESGERKSSVNRILMVSIRELEAKWISEYQTQLSIYHTAFSVWEIEFKALTKKLQQDIKNGVDTEAAVQALRKCNNSKPKAPVRKRVVINDISTAAIKKELGTGWASVGLYSDEAGSILSSELLSNSPLLNALWNGSSIEIDRINMESFTIEDARLSCMFMVRARS